MPNTAVSPKKGQTEKGWLTDEERRELKNEKIKHLLLTDESFEALKEYLSRFTDEGKS